MELKGDVSALAIATFLCAPATAANLPDLTAIVRAAALEAWPAGKVPAGAGFFIGPADVITASHVIAGCRSIRIRDRTRKLAASIVASDSRIDAALLHAETEGHAYLNFARMDSQGSGPVAIFGRSWADGAVSRVPVRSSAETGEKSLIGLSARLHPGNSGAAVVDARGELEAYVIGRLAQRHEIAVAVPAANLRKLFDAAAPRGLRRAVFADDGRRAKSSASVSDAIVAVTCAS